MQRHIWNKGKTNMEQFQYTNVFRAAFAREATWGAGLKHPQLARVLGLSLLEPPCAALDRGDAAPLPTILRMDRKLK